jgi:type VI secretion system secreted protein VgrG
VSAAGRSEKKGETNPANMVEAAMQMTLRSSSLGGSGGHNEITMHDAGGAEKLFLRAQKDEVHLVQNDRDDTVLRNVNRLIGQDETKSIARNKMQLVGGNADETIGGSHFVTIGDNFQMNVSGNFSSAVGGTQDESTVGKRSISVQDAMAITVKEGRVDNARFYEMVAQSTLYWVGSFLGFHKLSPAKPSEGEAAPPPGAMEKTAWIEIGEDSAITIANEKASIVIDKDGVIHLNGKKILLNC